MQEPARIAIDLGPESCSISLLRWEGASPAIEVVQRIPNGPVYRGGSFYWPLDAILAGIEEGLRKAAQTVLEGIASIAVDGWGVDYLRLGANGKPLRDPFCSRDERTVPTKKAADALLAPFEIYKRAGALPQRSNTVYQLLADQAAGIDPHTPWVALPEFILHWLGGKRVAEYTQATHTGLVDLKTGGWDAELFQLFGIAMEAAPPIVRAGTRLGRMQGPLAALDAFRETELIAPACHDTASALAGVSTPMDGTAYLCSGTQSVVGALTAAPVTTREALKAHCTNLGTATGENGFYIQTNGMALLQQCLESWKIEGRIWKIEDLIAQAASSGFPGAINVDAEPLLLDANMPERINHQLWRRRWATIPDELGNEPVFARVIFESLATRYATAIASLEVVLGHKFERLLILGSASQNKLLCELTQQRTSLPVESGHPESSTIGNFAVQLAASQANGKPIEPGSIRQWAQRLNKV